MCLPWKKQHPLLPDNYELSRRRLQSLLRRLRRTPDILQEYDSAIQKQLELSIVQPVPDSDPGLVGQVHYLSHHAVVKQERETSKVRVVYDASAKDGGPSLNECLLTGPNYNQRILDILLRFCSYPVALTSDIERAFLMVALAEEDTDVLRFLWIDDIAKPDPDVRVLRFTRVVFGVSSSPYLLNATLDHHLRLFSFTDQELVEVLLRSIYVDYVVAGAANEEAALKLYKESKRVLQEGGFNLRKFLTNKPQLQRAINVLENPPISPADARSVCSEETTYAKSTLGEVQMVSLAEQKVLGVKWDVTTDCLIFSVQNVASLAEFVEPTKRRITSIIGKFYDPLGFLSPIVIKFFKELCEEGMEWDQELTGDIRCKWQSLVASLRCAPTLSFPRLYWQDAEVEAASCNLHGFCDASVGAYAAVVYLVAQTGSGRCVSFVASKTRISPRRQLTIYTMS